MSEEFQTLRSYVWCPTNRSPHDLLQKTLDEQVKTLLDASHTIPCRLACPTDRYMDTATGKSLVNRSALLKLLRDLNAGDLVMVVALEQMGLDLASTAQTLGIIARKGASLLCLNQFDSDPLFLEGALLGLWGTILRVGGVIAGWDKARQVEAYSERCRVEGLLPGHQPLPIGRRIVPGTKPRQVVWHAGDVAKMRKIWLRWNRGTTRKKILADLIKRGTKLHNGRKLGGMYEVKESIRLGELAKSAGFGSDFSKLHPTSLEKPSKRRQRSRPAQPQPEPAPEQAQGDDEGAE